jgi:hypothetical protein
MPSQKLRPLSVPVPRLKRDIGLGDAVKRVTAAVGIRPCGGCGQRAAALNRVFVFRAAQRTK